MTLAQIIASGVGVIIEIGDTIFTTIFGIFPVWFRYAIPLAMIVGIVTYFLTRRGPGGGHK